MLARMLLPPLVGAALFAAPPAPPTAPAAACPPSLTVERPAHPGRRDAGAAFLLVHLTHGCHPGTLAVDGTAEGLLGGERRSVRLDLVPTAAPDVYEVRRQWPADGAWVLDLRVTEGDGYETTLVEVGPSGEIARIHGPGRNGRAASAADVDTLLRRLAAG